MVQFEIRADEPERAIASYEKCFGWAFTPWEGTEEYWTITTGSDGEPGINGRLIRRRTPIDGEAVIAYVCTIDIASTDDAEVTVTAHGGTIALPKQAIRVVGWLFYAKDTEGNVFGVRQQDRTAK